jgi:retron-type reverse transcriptase
VRDRVLHHAIFQILSPLFEPTFITESFSCRINKGTHKGVEHVKKILRKISKNYTKTCFVLKCDIKKFFDSVDHRILLNILDKSIKDEDTMWLLKEIVGSFISERTTLFNCCGIPIGNLTSQLFANVYMNKFDQFIKHDLKVKHYARYTDDFIVISDDREYLQKLLGTINVFLIQHLNLELHPEKVSIRKFNKNKGVDFLGYIILPHYKLVRIKTRKRMFKKMKEQARQYRDGSVSKETMDQSMQSYLGVLSHANTYRLSEKFKNQYWYWISE